MSTETTQTPRLSLLHVDFRDLYSRHLGRHSQFGINVGHLLALYGLWFGAYAVIDQTARLLGIPASWTIVVAMSAAYLATVCINAPPSVCLATAAFLTVFVASVLALPRLPAWSIPAFLLLIPAGYKFQAWNHKVWTVAADMSEFNKRFPPGRDLNLILLIYEVPICLNYLLFRRADWRP
jgi:hypothetical protein